MSPIALFVVGLMVTLIVGAAVALLVYAAVLDGRRQRELTEAESLRTIAANAVFTDPAPDGAPLGAAGTS